MTRLPRTNENFYRLAWDARLALIEPWCAQPGATPFRVIRQLESFEARNRLMLDLEADRPDGEAFFTGAHRWEPIYADPGALLPTGVPPFVEVAIRDRTAMAPFYADLGGIAARWIADHCAQQRYDAYVELGSGSGRNIFAIHAHGGPIGPYHACELAEGGRKIAERLASLDPALSVTTHPFDLRAPDFDFLAGAERVLLFSIHAIEQVTTLPDDFFERLARAGRRVTGMHFEPFGYQFGNAHPNAARQKARADEYGWNRDLLAKLRAANERRTIAMTFLSENLFANSLENPTSVAIWECGPR